MKNLLFNIIFALIITTTFGKTTNAQVSCNELINSVQQYQYKDNVSCFNSSMLTKAYYYVIDDIGFVIAYIKQNDSDIFGKPYIFCNISEKRWNTFKSEGMYNSWGQAFHDYIYDYKCNCY
jgi:hypothetical protein